MARIVEMGTSLASMGKASWDSWDNDKVALRLAVVLRNALPLPLVFGPPGTTEVLDLPSGAQRGYASETQVMM
eukprot:symbB.v1.2.008152.t1/scaffold510.1/size193565/2